MLWELIRIYNIKIGPFKPDSRRRLIKRKYNKNFHIIIPFKYKNFPARQLL